VLQAEKCLKKTGGKILVLPGDAPCVCAETLRQLVDVYEEKGAQAGVLSARVENPFGYGRILRDGEAVIGIREELDASDEERQIAEVNSGIYVFDAALLFDRLKKVAKNDKKKEYYLTDVIEEIVRAGGKVVAHMASDSSEIMGVNTRMDLSEANRVLNAREIERHQKAGVTIVEPRETSIEKNVTIGRDTIIHPFTWIEHDVVIGEGCRIGPFAKLRNGSRIGDEAVIGSFVEVARSKIGAKTFVKHLSYVGDSEFGEKVNVGAGTVTANFDGSRKNKTIVEDNVFLGCNTVLIAPLKVGRGAKTGAGAVVCARQAIAPGKVVMGVPARAVANDTKKKRRAK
jgi:bifunctional UDP-N-acetylglucosamine pyrophosphorylase/glucosamine-1-phosphate N-acetyltransferase